MNISKPTTIFSIYSASRREQGTGNGEQKREMLIVQGFEQFITMAICQ